jgi:hypothetical protein
MENSTETTARHAAILAKHGLTEEQFAAILAEAKPAHREWRKMQGHFTPEDVAKFEATFTEAEQERIQLKIANPSR